MIERTVRIRDFDCWYRHYGTDGDPVLLVMGFGMSGIAWHPQATRLEGHHRVVLYDSRGLGKSTEGAGPHDLHTMADDTAALLDHLGWERAHVVGVSMGGMIAQHLALRHTGRVRSLSLIATSPGPLTRNLPGGKGIRLFLQANTSKGEGRLNALRKLLFPPEYASQTVDPSMLEAIGAPSKPHVRLSHLRSIFSHDVRKELGALASVPTLVIKPALDLLVPPRGSDAIAANLPGARLVEFADGGHGLTAQHPEAVTRLLREHFAAA